MEVREPNARYLVKPGFKQTEAGVIPKDWKVVTLGEIGKFKNGLNKDSASFGHGSPFVNLMDVFGVNSICDCEQLGLVASTSLEQCTYDLKKGDVIFIRSSVKPSGVGLTAVVERDLPKTTYSGFLIRFRDQNLIEDGYKKHCFYTPRFRSSVIAGSSVSANTNINQETLKKLTIPLPSTKAEQQAIAEALSDADALVEALEQLLAKKRQIKQGAMQELLTGQKRLSGFSGEWKEVALGQWGKCYRGVSYNPNADLSSFDTGNTIRLLRSNNVQGASVIFEGMQYVDASRVSAEQRLKKNDILVCMANGSRDLVGKSGRFAANDGFEYTFGAFMGGFRPNLEQEDPSFVFYVFQTEAYRNHISILLAGSSINNLTPKSIESFMAFSPTDKAEQTAIATVLSDLDAELAALETKLAKARQLKQGMMQELLTGRIRLV